jgi:hypothetical protein
VLPFFLCACSDKGNGDDVDADGDGFPAADDCDDGNPLGWLAPDELDGSLTEDFTDFCTGYCERSIGEHLDLSDATAADVASLSCLTSVGGDLWVNGNAALMSLAGLGSLSSVGGDLWVRANDALTSLAGLEDLSSVGGDLAVFDNYALCEEEVDDLEVQLTSFSGTVTNTGNTGTCPTE